MPSLYPLPVRFFAILFLALTMASSMRAQTVIFSDGFENGLNGWLFGDDNISAPGIPSYWGVVNSGFGNEGIHGGTNKVYCAAVGYVGSTTAPNYQPNMSAYLVRTLDLTGRTNATLSFWHKIPTIEPPQAEIYDYAEVWVDNTVVWHRDTIVTTWTQVTLSLEAFIGSSHTLKFLFVSDYAIQKDKIYLLAPVKLLLPVLFIF